MKHRNLSKIKLLLDEMEQEYTDKEDNLDEETLGSTEYNQRTDYYAAIYDQIMNTTETIEDFANIQVDVF